MRRRAWRYGVRPAAVAHAHRAPAWSFRRWAFAFGVLGTLLVLAATVAQGQAVPRTLQDSIESARRQRMALEAALERQLATGIAERAKNLAMSEQASALQRIETLLDSAQARLLVQRDRIRLLKDAATQTDKAVLVVLLRAEALPEGELGAVVMIDGAQQKVVTVTPDRARTLLAGGADELYRAEVAPVDHKIVVSLAARGLSASEAVTLPTNPREVRYVEFALRNGRLVPTSWTSRSTAP